MRLFLSRVSPLARSFGATRNYTSLQMSTQLGRRFSRVPSQPLAAASLRCAKQSMLSKRFYSEGPQPVTREFAFERIAGVLSNCDKIDPSKITLDARLEEDLGLDSLDVVDALFYVEEEFTVQMPDHEADELKTVGDVVEWVVKQPDAF